MVKAIIVIRELGQLKVDYSLEFDLPELPRVGDYISIHRPDTPGVFSEDIVVRAVWWRLEHPETSPVTSQPKCGKVVEIFIECDFALGPYATDRWRAMVEGARAASRSQRFRFLASAFEKRI